MLLVNCNMLHIAPWNEESPGSLNRLLGLRSGAFLWWSLQESATSPCQYHSITKKHNPNLPNLQFYQVTNIQICCCSPTTLFSMPASLQGGHKQIFPPQGSKHSNGTPLMFLKLPSSKQSPRVHRVSKLSIYTRLASSVLLQKMKKRTGVVRCERFLLVMLVNVVKQLYVGW